MPGITLQFAGAVISGTRPPTVAAKQPAAQPPTAFPVACVAPPARPSAVAPSGCLPPDMSAGPSGSSSGVSGLPVGSITRSGLAPTA